MIFAAIADWAEHDEFPIDFMCTELHVSRSGYYAWRNRPVSHRALTDIDLTSRIRRIHAAGRGNPGVRRVRAGLAAEGIRCGLGRILRLMQAADLQGRHPKAWRRTTIKGEKPVSAPDLIGRRFTAAAPNVAWCGDITYVRTWTGWAYLATVIDLHSRAVVGWAIADHMRTSLIIDALQMACGRRNPPPGVIFHSDRGTQYTSQEFDEYCRRHHIRRSLGRTGVCWDNAVAESFFATYKKELIHTRPWPSIDQLKTATFSWIESYYNRGRRHSSIGYLTPMEYELGFRDIHELAA